MHNAEDPVFPESDSLLDEALKEPSRSSVSRVLFAQRKWLVPFVAKELDPRLAARLDAKDVVQEVLIEAAIKMAAFLQWRPVPFGVWLQQIAHEQVAHTHRTHIIAAKRSVDREVHEASEDPWDAGISLDNLPTRRPSPSSTFGRTERQEILRAAIEQLTDAEREVLFMRQHGRQSTKEIAAQLGITESAVRTRQLRAVRRLREILGGEFI